MRRTRARFLTRSSTALLVTALLAARGTAAPQEHVHGEEKTAAPAVKPPALFTDLGDYHRAISTRSPEAQRWFDQGLRLVFAFNHDEAQRAFEEALRIDPACAICAWGAALCLGPNINLPAAAERAAAAWKMERTALRLVPGASHVERALIEALSKRYSDPPAADQGSQKRLDSSYAAAMRAVSRRFPKDLDAATLFAESMMDLRPWDLWKHDGTPQPGTLEIVRTLEGVLARDRNHPGANHYYVHAVEASRHPERGIRAAGRLAGMMPGAGHLVHMPSHIYIRTGQYEEAAEANRKAIAADAKYVAAASPAGMYQMYVLHNQQFLFAAAMDEGRPTESIQAARVTAQGAPVEMLKEMPGFDIVLTYPPLALVRFGRWEEALREPVPPGDFPFATAMWHYARGVASAALGRAEDASAEKKELDRLAAGIPADARESLNSARDLLAVASKALAGRIAAHAGDTAAAVRELSAAAAAEDALSYAEPPDWYSPVRQTLGAVLLRAGRAKEAERVYRDDLARNPRNGWSLAGLAEALKAQGNTAAEAHARRDFEKAWRNAEVKIAGSDY